MAEGGCLCGAVRYAVEGPPLDAGYCHCRLCQRSAGAPVLAWGTWAAARFAWSRGEPASFASSAHARRLFCPGCGTQLVFVDARAPDLHDVTLASLDEPAAIPPEYHIWVMSRISWFDTSDGLPRHDDGKPDTDQMERRSPR